jgi:hypothetical protein
MVLTILFVFMKWNICRPGLTCHRYIGDSAKIDFNMNTHHRVVLLLSLFVMPRAV